MSRKLIYEGSVKNLWDLGSEKLEFEYSDAYSVFDWGRMPDSLAYKGESLAALGAYFFKETGLACTWQDAALAESPWLKAIPGSLGELVQKEIELLEREGLKSHFIEQNGKTSLIAKRVGVVAPKEHKLAGQTLYEYRRADKTSSQLIPLEVVFRFGMPPGSSLSERLTPEYAGQLGLKKMPVPGHKLELPVIEFFSKLEDTDRFLTWEQALNYSGLEFANFERLIGRTLCVAVWLYQKFKNAGLELWDGKFEWALDEKGALMLVDSIGPDELRILDPKSGAQISKEFLRLFYRKTKWFEAVKKSKLEAASNPEVDWKKKVLSDSGPPPPLDRDFKAAADALYPSLALALCGQNPGGCGLPIPSLLERISKCLAK